ncbi:O-antigen ligase family protein [Caldibacillus thermoamylovorans]|uniref:O-antigen ligase family protein n=1 Tax=Caldibacillus thermoamylovorans TaxID=35841 RepID=UPI0022E5A9C1|nr:O-antigen ligase family protein [Caldibacillus thermoamylovorans]
MLVIKKNIITQLIAIAIGVLVSFQPFLPPIILLGLAFLLLSVKYTIPAFFTGLLFIVIEGFVSSFFTSPLIIDAIGLIPEIIFFDVLAVLFIKRKFSIPNFNLYDYILLLLISWSIFISLFQHGDLFLTAFGFRLLFRFILIYWIVKMLNVKKEDFLEQVSRFLIVIVFIESGLALFQVLGKVLIGPAHWNTFGNNLIMSTSVFGVQGTFNRYDMLGMFLGFSSIVILGYYLFYRKTKIYLIAYLAALFGVFVSTSRQAIIISIIGALVLFLSPIKRALKVKIAFISVYIIVFGGLLLKLIVPDIGLTSEGRNPIELFFSLFDSSTYSTEKHENFRLYFITVIGSWLTENHFWGMGLGTFGATFSFEQFEWLYLSLGLNDNFSNYIADVNWISILGQIGVIGLVGFCLFLLIFFFKSIYKGSVQSNGILLIASAIALTWMISGLFGPNFEIKSNAMFFWLFLGLALKKEQNQ